MSGSVPDEQKGLVFNIQRFSIKDGPGIRTTVFMKGCPLRCLWCCNPESQNTYPEIMTHDIRCARCGKCAQICPAGAITVSQESRIINRVKCNLCLECARVCPHGAISAVGEYKTAAEIMKEVESDRIFYEHSGGGMTVSGGEPLVQWDFVRQLLKACREKGLSTALDTCGYSPWEAIEKVLECTDLVLFDIKHMGPEQHRQATAKGNELILDNLRKTAAKGIRLWFRIPLIPGYNDLKEHIEQIARFGAEIGVERVWLLPYHNWGMSKYESLGRRYTFEPTGSLRDEYIQSLKELITGFGVEAGVSQG